MRSLVVRFLILLGLLFPALASAVTPMVAAGRGHDVALKSDGTVAAWGNNIYGQLGDGTTTDSLNPVAVPGLTGVVAVVAGGYHTVALKSDGTVVVWGRNIYGQVGDGTTTERHSPVAVPGLTGVMAVAAGFDYTVALKSNGTVVAWGDNSYGQLGDGTQTSRVNPVAVPGLSGVAAVAASFHTVALKSNGTVMAWGQNRYGQLGDGTTTERHSPVAVPGLTGAGVVAVAAGDYHTVALNSAGTIWAWGKNGSRQVDVTNTDRLSPTNDNRASGTGVTAVAAGAYHTVALRSDGTVVAWGDNSYGQLGNGTTTVSYDSVVVPRLTGVVAVSASGNHTVALKSDGTVWNWGNTIMSPVDVPGLPNKISQNISFGIAPALVAGGTGTVSATATSGLQVGFSSTTPSVCTVSGSTLSGILVGTCTIAADQVGNPYYKAAAQVTQSITVGKGSQTLSFGAAPVIAIGGTNTVSATSTSGLAVSYTSTSPGVCTVSGSSVTGIAMGTCTIAANQAGNANYNAAAQVTQSIIIGNKASQTISFGSIPTVAVGGAGTVSATATSGLAVVFSSTTPTFCTVSGSTVTGVASGTCTIAADQTGSANYNAATQGTQSFTIKTNQTVNFGSAPTIGAGGTGSVSATATSGLAVGFTTVTPSFCSVSGDTVTGVAAGTCTIAANQAGNANYSAAVQVTQSFTIKTNQTVSFGAAPVLVAGGTGTVSAAATSGLAVSFSSTTLTVCTVNGSTVTGVTGGNCIIAADQAGNTNFNAASEVLQSINVKANQTVSFGTAPTLVVGGSGIVSAAATSGLAVSFSSTTPTVCSVSGSSVTGITVGTCTIAANQAGNASYSTATQVTQSITVGKGNQSVSFGAAPTLAFGGTGTVSATATSGLAVSFSSTTPSVCTISGSTVTGLTGGTCIIAGNQAGNADYTAAPQVTQSITVGKIDQTIGAISFSPATLAVGGTVTATATATSALAPSYSSTTPAVCTVSGSAVTGITAGTCTIVADQAGDANYNAATQVSQSITVKVLVFGTVTDLSTGSAIAGAAVSVTGGTSTQTDVKGYYQITGLNPGLYAATFSKSGYQSLTVSNVLVTTLGAGLSVQLTTPGLLNITTTNLPHAEIGVAYNDGVRASGGTWPYVFSVAYGTLPSGLSLDATNGNIVGTPSSVGAYTFAIGVTDKLNAVAEREFTLEVTQPLSITNASALRRGTLGADYFQTIQATGGTQPYTWLKSAGSLPAGLAIASNGNISGKPTALGTSQFTERVTDASSRSTEKNFSLEIVNPLLVSTTRLNNGIVGSAYNQTLSASGGHGNYSWAVYSGSLPAGLALDSQTGIVTGSPTAATYGIIVFSVSDEDGRITYKDFSITVSKPLKILVSAVPNGLKNAQYSEAIRLEGGIGPYLFSSSGQLPAGLALNSATGVISGIPTAAGLTNVNITVTDSTWPVSQTVTQLLGIRVTSLLTVTSSAVLPMERRNIAISPIVLVAQGGSSPYGWELTAGYLPQGFALNPQTGELSGTPLDSGDFVFKVKVTDAVAATAEKEFFWHISDALTVDTGAVADAAVGVPYSFTVNAKGGLPLYSWRLLSGTLPNGLSINGSTGTLSGTPSTKQTFQFTVEVSDADNPAQKAEKTYSMDVLDTLFVYTNLLPNGRVNEAYTATVKAELGTPPYSWRLESGALPAGLSLASSATVATIEGTPTAKGSYAFYLEVSDSGTPVKKAIKQYTGEIYGDVTIDSTGLKTATRGVPYSDNIAVSGGALPYSYSVSAGVLPSGLNFNSISGNISGITNMPTGFSAAFKVKVSDSGNPYDSNEKDFVIYVVDPLSITTQIIQGALQGSAYQANIAGLGGLSPYTWSAQSGLPTGLQIDPATGVISGTPAGCGVFNFNVHLSDAAPLPNKTLHAFDLNVTCSGATTTSSTTTTTTVATTTTSTQPQGQTGTMSFDLGWNLAGNGSTSSMDVGAQFADTARITSVWKWINATSTWAFYAPSMSSQALADYAAGKDYEVLSVINGGEGFWVNAKTAFNATLPAGTAVTSASFATALASGWSLISTGDNKTPRAFNNSLSATPPTPPAVAASVLTTLWAWNSTQSTWYFYAPTLDNSGGLAAYVASKGYLDFGSSTLVPGMGFWVNRP